MELKDNLPIKYHLQIHKLAATYPTEFDIEMDILFILLEHNRKKHRKKVKGDLPVDMFQQYYSNVDEVNQPKTLEVFKTLKDQGQLNVNDNIIEVSKEFINKFLK